MASLLGNLECCEDQIRFPINPFRNISVISNLSAIFQLKTIYVFSTAFWGNLKLNQYFTYFSIVNMPFELPIINMAYLVVTNQIDVKDGLQKLLARDLKEEKYC